MDSPAVGPAPPSSSRNAANASVAASSLATTSARTLNPGGGVRLLTDADVDSCAHAAASAFAVLIERRDCPRWIPSDVRRLWGRHGARHRSRCPSATHATKTPRPSIAGDAATHRARNSHAAVAVAHAPDAVDAARIANTFSKRGPA